MIRWIRISRQIGTLLARAMINESVIHLALCGRENKRERLISKVSFSMSEIYLIAMEKGTKALKADADVDLLTERRN